MSSTITIREIIHNKLLKLRAIDAMVHRPQFERLWFDSTPEQQQEIINAIENCDKDRVNEWIQNHSSLDIEELKISQLRILAKKYRVPGYSRSNRPELIASIRRYERLRHEFEQSKDGGVDVSNSSINESTDGKMQDT